MVLPGTRSGYLFLTRSDSAFLSSKVCSALNFILVNINIIRVVRSSCSADNYDRERWY